MSTQGLAIRTAGPTDVEPLRRLIEASVRGLQTGDYTTAQIEGALGHALGLDTQLVQDGTYFVVEAPGEPGLLGCGGWSYRRTLFGSDGGPQREAARLDPGTEAARIRAIFVHPARARQGLGSLILQHCEAQAEAAGFRRFEMGSTLTGVPLYRQKGYVPVARIAVPLPNAEALPVVRMVKEVVAMPVAPAPPAVLREAAEDDMEAVLRLYGMAGLEQDGFTVAEAVAQLRAFRGYPSFRVFVATVAGIVAGTYELAILDNLAKRGRRSGVVEDVAVHPAYQGEGIGRAMMRHALAQCRAAGCYKMMLSSNLRREAAHGFYEALGFARHGYSFQMELPDE